MTTNSISHTNKVSLFTNHTFYRSCRVILVLALVITTFANGLLAQFVGAHQTLSATAASSVGSGHTMNSEELTAQLQAVASDGSITDKSGTAWQIIQPHGVPTVYGEALGVSFDDPVAAIDVMKQYDPYKQVNLINQSTLERYIQIGLLISCQYCCSAQTMVFDNGVASCGCAHSRAMRGLTRYLLEAYPQMTNDQILTELVQWKALYFPRDASALALELASQNNFNINTYLINNVK